MRRAASSLLLHTHTKVPEPRRETAVVIVVDDPTLSAILFVTPLTSCHPASPLFSRSVTPSSTPTPSLPRPLPPYKLLPQFLRFGYRAAPPSLPLNRRCKLFSRFHNDVMLLFRCELLYRRSIKTVCLTF